VDRREEVNSIITFDSNQDVSISEDQTVKKNVDKIINYYIDLFGKIIPHIK